MQKTCFNVKNAHIKIETTRPANGTLSANQPNLKGFSLFYTLKKPSPLPSELEKLNFNVTSPL